MYIQKALVDVSRRVKDALDSNFVSIFVNRVKNQVATKRHNKDTYPEIFPQRGTLRCVQDQETAGADFLNETECPSWIVVGDEVADSLKIEFSQGGKSGNALGLRHGFVFCDQAVKDFFRQNAGAAVDARSNLLP